jgi:hypothetical protein
MSAADRLTDRRALACVSQSEHYALVANSGVPRGSRTCARALSVLAVMLVPLSFTGCGSSTSARGSSTSTSGPPTTLPSVVAQISTYRQRASAANDHVFDPCHNAVVATPKPTVDPYSLPVCSARGIAAGIDEAVASVSALSHRVASFHSSAAPASVVTETVTKLDALAAALRSWERCAVLLKSRPYFAGGHCGLDVRRVDAARVDLTTLARRWPES